jgi:hypothetical protein
MRIFPAARPLARLSAVALLLALGQRSYAPPPIITGDVPIADVGRFELYTGFRYQETSRVQRQMPHVELVYGFTDRWEASVEANYLSRAGRNGFDDLTLATKVVLAVETPTRPMLGASYELKLDNGDAERGLGSGGFEHEFRLRAQKTFGWFTPIVNAGYVFVPDAEIAGARAPRQDVWRASCAQEWQVAKWTKLLTEIYWRTADEPREPHRLGWNAGFKHRLRDSLSVHAAVGESLRDGNRGGPDLRVYAGLKWEFDAPWKGKATSP